MNLPSSTYYQMTKSRHNGEQVLIARTDTIIKEFSGYEFRGVTLALHCREFKVKQKMVIRAIQQQG